MLVKSRLTMGEIYAIIKKNNKGDTSKKAFILFLFSTFLDFPLEECRQLLKFFVFRYSYK